jgi:hypothetical protein
MMQFVDVADIAEGTLFGSLAQFEPAPDMLDLEVTGDGSLEDGESQWIVWEAVGAEYEWAATELTSLTAVF